MISYKYNIYYSKKTKYFDKMLRECCFVWNHALALQRRYYRMFGKYISVNRIQKQDWSRLRAVPAPAKGTPSPGWGQLGRGNDVRVKYVSINSGLGGDRL